MDHTLTGNNSKITSDLGLQTDTSSAHGWRICGLTSLPLLVQLSLATYQPISLPLSLSLTLSLSRSVCRGRTWSSISAFHVLVPNDCSQSSASWGFCWKLAVFGTSTLPLTPHSDCFRENIRSTPRWQVCTDKSKISVKVSYYSKPQLNVFGSTRQVC